MPYAVMVNGSYRAVDDSMILADGETLYDDVPQWAYEAAEARLLLMDKTTTEIEWRSREMDFIANQLTAIEDEDPVALPGTTKQWRDYRIQVRAWFDGAESYPEPEYRPARPE